MGYSSGGSARAPLRVRTRVRAGAGVTRKYRQQLLRIGMIVRKDSRSLSKG